MISDLSIINAVGLSLDIVGVIMIFYFGISPNFYDQNKETLYIGTMTPQMQRKAKIYKRLSIFGLFLCILGFLIQIIVTISK